MYTGFRWGNLRERDRMEDPGVDGRITIKWIFMKWDGDMGWIDVAQNRDKWRALVNGVIKIWVRKIRGNS